MRSHVERGNDKYYKIIFCELDSDLQPWDKSGARKLILSDLYDSSGVYVQGDFLLESLSSI